jgi:hypothetical protein
MPFGLASTDGRFVFSRFVTGDGPSVPASAVLVLNFFEELRQRVPDLSALRKLDIVMR